MSKGLEELNKIKIFEYTYPNIIIKPFKITADNPNKNRTVTTIGKTFNKEIKIIEKELKAKEELEKAFDTLSKDDEKAKKLLSLEIEKNRTLEIIKDKAVNLYYVEITNNYINYNRCIDEFFGNYEHRDIYYLTKEEYDSVKR